MVAIMLSSDGGTEPPRTDDHVHRVDHPHLDDTAKVTGEWPNADRATTHAAPLAAALDMVARGAHMFPLHNPDEAGGCSCRRGCGRDCGKHPRTRHGLRDASNDVTVITEWWRRWPTANIGLRTGAVSGVFVLDVDPDGFEPFEALARTHGAAQFCPDTWSVRTGREGAHLYFRHPGAEVRVPTNAGQLASGVDVRGDDGYTVLPPSRHATGRHYAWVAGFAPWEVPLADAPAWLLTLVAAPPSTHAPALIPPLTSDAVIGEGQRNAALTSLAGTMRRRGFTEPAIAAALRVENAARCQPPLPDTEVEKIARSVTRYAPAVQRATWRGLRLREVRRA